MAGIAQKSKSLIFIVVTWKIEIMGKAKKEIVKALKTVK